MMLYGKFKGYQSRFNFKRRKKDEAPCLSDVRTIEYFLNSFNVQNAAGL
jgi:hypothetical protein